MDADKAGHPAPHGITPYRQRGTSSRLDDPACPAVYSRACRLSPSSMARTSRVLPAPAVESAPVVEAATIVVPAIAVVLAAVVLAAVVLAFLILAAVVVALVVFAFAVVVAAEEPVAAEQVAQRFGRQNAAADAEGDLACPRQETLATRSLPAGWLLVLRRVTAVALLTGASPPGLSESGRRSALP